MHNNGVLKQEELHFFLKQKTWNKQTETRLIRLAEQNKIGENLCLYTCFPCNNGYMWHGEQSPQAWRSLHPQKKNKINGSKEKLHWKDREAKPY